MTGLEKLGVLATGLGAAFVSNILVVALNTAVLGIGVFFFLRDGQRWLRSMVEIVPLEPEHEKIVLVRLDQTLSAVVRGQLVTAVVQGVLATIGYVIAGLPNAIMLGFATMFMSLIPLVGAAGVWIPSAAYVLSVGPTWAGIFMVLWGVLVVSLIDNFLKPKLIGDKARIPTFLLLFGLLLTFMGILREETATLR